MITIPYRRDLTLIMLTLIFVAGVGYDTLAIQPHNRARLLLVACVAAGFAVLFLLQRYPRDVVQPVFLAAWPMHLYTIAFVGVCVVFHNGNRLDQVLVYTALAYAAYVLIPLIFCSIGNSFGRRFPSWPSCQPFWPSLHLPVRWAPTISWDCR